MVWSDDNIDLSLYIDDRNKELFESLSSTKILVRQCNGDDYGTVRIPPNLFVIFVSSQVSPAAFAHELLHIQLHEDVGSLYDLNYSSYGFSQECYSHLTNTLTHRTMIHRFLEMGYVEEEFLSCGRDKYITIDDLKSHNTDFNTIIVDCLTVLGYCLSFHDFETEKEFLQQNHPKYYNCVKSLIEAWDKYIYPDGCWVRFFYNGFGPFLKEIQILSNAEK